MRIYEVHEDEGERGGGVIQEIAHMPIAHGYITEQSFIL
jgi:hypothetical protein